MNITTDNTSELVRTPAINASAREDLAKKMAAWERKRGNKVTVIESFKINPNAHKSATGFAQSKERNTRVGKERIAQILKTNITTTKEDLCIREASITMGLASTGLGRARCKKEIYGVGLPEEFKVGCLVRYKVTELKRWLEEFKKIHG